jgi:hypothetical protein
MICVSRVPIHVATIENSTLIPLRDGKNITNLIAESLNIIEDKKNDLI